MMDKKYILETSNLHKSYGKITAVNQLNLKIEEGVVFGMLGPNGSGKTTTLGMLLGVTRPTSGNFSWFGQGNHASLRRKIGAILEQPIFYPYMNAVENLEITCMIKQADKTTIDDILKSVGLYERRLDDFKTYSLGMKQRLAIGASLIGDPKVLILDEPTNGLDPQGIVQIRTLISEIAATGKTIILASHLLDEVQKICTHFGVLRNGSLIYQGVVKDDFSDGITFQLNSGDNDKLISILEKKVTISQVKRVKDYLEIKFPNPISGEEINSLLLKEGLILSHISLVEKTLEEQFLEILNVVS